MKHDKLNNLLTGLLVILIVFELFFIRIRVPTESMANTILPKDEFLVLRDFWVGDYQRGDIVVFKKDGEENLLVKRLIGLPGEHISIKNGIVYVNEKELCENYLGSVDEEYSGEFDLPNNAYLLLGDNRENSYDARYWGDDYITEDKFKGKVLFKIKPSFEKINSYDYSKGLTELYG